ncbi:hypothetical protein A2U01_0070091, partial [Trifolium medium]|nr:hypothetical protein [Trifolium medium]
ATRTAVWRNAPCFSVFWFSSVSCAARKGDLRCAQSCPGMAGGLMVPARRAG